jgi:uncharacterized protein (DUF1778 family)
MPTQKATKKEVPLSRTSPGIKTTRTEGYVQQTIRLDVVDNALIHLASKEARQSFNSWAVNALVIAAESALPKKARQQLLKEMSIG